MKCEAMYTYDQGASNTQMGYDFSIKDVMKYPLTPPPPPTLWPLFKNKLPIFN